MDLSIVTTMYCSAPYLAEFHRRASAAAQKITNDFEIIFVNDGSPDNSLETAISLLNSDERVRIIDLSRNFGHHKAMMTGLADARGELIFLLDSDLEEEPELLNLFYEEMKRTKSEVVYGVQSIRRGSIFERLSGEFYYSLFNLFSPYRIPRNVVTARLMVKQYVTALIRHLDREVNMLGLWTLTGFHQTACPVNKHRKGTSTYNFTRKVAHFVNAITSFSNRPLIIILYIGFGISFISCTAASYLAFRRIFHGVYLEGWASLIVSIWMLGGLTIFCLGIIGIYISKIFSETKRRPYTVIRQIYQRNQNVKSDEACAALMNTLHSLD